jgi:hypothetical protein
MAFLKRLGWYLVGLSIGLVFLVFFLKKKTQDTGLEFCYLPNCRVLKDLRSKPLSLSDKALAQMESQELDTLLVKSFFRDGDVDFKKSDTRSGPCKTYYISKNIEEASYTLEVKSCEKETIVRKLSKE